MVINVNNKPQFTELINTLDLTDNQTFKFELSYNSDNKNIEEKQQYYGYFKYNDIDKLYDATTDQEFTGGTVGFEGKNVVLADRRQYYLEKKYANYIQGISNFKLIYISNGKEKTLNCYQSIDDPAVSYYYRSSEDSFFKLTPNFFGTIIQSPPFENSWYLQISDYIDDGTSIVVQAIPSYKEGTIEDIRRKIYTGIIPIETAPYSKLNSQETTLLQTLQKQEYTYLCGTPKGELYAFKAKSANDLIITSINSNSANTAIAWAHPKSEIFKDVQTLNIGTSLGLRIASSFIPLQSTSQFLYTAIPQNDKELRMMQLGFISVFAKS